MIIYAQLVTIGPGKGHGRGLMIGITRRESNLGVKVGEGGVDGDNTGRLLCGMSLGSLGFLGAGEHEGCHRNSSNYIQFFHSCYELKSEGFVNDRILSQIRQELFEDDFPAHSDTLLQGKMNDRRCGRVVRPSLICFVHDD